MIDANKGTPESVLQRLKEGSYERFRIELLNSVEQLLIDFEMTWDDLANKLQWDVLKRPCQGPIKLRSKNGEEVKKSVGEGELNMDSINDIAAVFSTEPYIIFKSRLPWTKS